MKATQRLLEVCTGSYADAMAAWRGGAKRIELNSALCAGGLTPASGTLRKIKKETDLEVICMVRPRAGGFCYLDEEFEGMLADAQDLLEAGADGLAFGFLNSDGSLNEEQTARMTELVHEYGKTAVFHRALDVCRNLDKTVDQLIDLKVDRILTSGQQETVIQGLTKIRHLYQVYGDRIEILAGSGVNAENVQKIMEDTGITQVHSSCKGYRRDPTTRTKDVSFTFLPEPYADFYDAVDEKKVRNMRDRIKAVK